MLSFKMAKEKIKVNKEQGKFIGMNYLTGRKIYLTPAEEKVIKEQQWKLAKTILWICGIFIFLILLYSVQLGPLW